MGVVEVRKWAWAPERFFFLLPYSSSVMNPLDRKFWRDWRVSGVKSAIEKKGKEEGERRRTRRRERVVANGHQKSWMSIDVLKKHPMDVREEMMALHFFGLVGFNK